MTKSMWRILPLILLAYLMAYMDRVNISFASLQMNVDLKFSASIYGLGAGLFFLAYAMFEVPSSLMLRRYSAPQWIARIMITWGLLAAGMMFVRTPLQFYVMRFLLGAIGLLINAAGTGLVLSAPAVLAMRAHLDTRAIGHVVAGGGMLGIIGVLFAGWNSDRHGDRFRDAFVFTIICMSGLILIGVAAPPILVMVGYLLFAATWFAGGVLIASSWADVLHPQQLAVGGAVINTLWQVGAFVSPYGFGLAKDATGSFTLGLIASAVVAGAQALLLLHVRARVASERRARERAAARPAALTP